MYSVLHKLYIRSYHDTWDQIWFSCWDSYLSQGKRMVEFLEWKDGMNAVVGGQHTSGKYRYKLVTLLTVPVKMV